MAEQDYPVKPPKVGDAANSRAAQRDRAAQAAKRKQDTDREEGRGSASKYAEAMVMPQELQDDVIENYTQGMELGRENRERANNRERFLLGEQWTDTELTERAGRPSLVDNKLPPSFHNIFNDLVDNMPSAKLKPRGDAHKDTALVLDGLLRYITNRSKAPLHRMSAAGQAIGGGYGYYKVMLDWVPGTFDREIRIVPVPNRNSIVDDWRVKEPDHSDRKYLYEINRLPEKEFRKKYPHNSVTRDPVLSGKPLGANWKRKEVPEITYWYKEIAEYKQIASGEKDPDTGEEITRDEPVWRVCWMLTNGTEILLNQAGRPLRGVWPGEAIPYPIVYGWRMFKADRGGETRLHIEGAFEQAHDPARLGNYIKSNAMEVIGQQPKTKFLTAEGQTADNQDEWDNIAVRAQTTVNFKLVAGPGGTPAPPPIPVPPPMLGDAIPKMIEWADGAVRDTTGMFQGAKGEATNDPSGYALEQRRVDNDTNHAHYRAHLALAIQFETSICLDLIRKAKLYGPKSRVWIALQDGTEQQVTVNSPQPGAGEENAPPAKSMWTDKDENNQVRKHFDLAVGDYELAMQIGPNFATQQEEERSGILEVMKMAPQQAPLLLPAYIRASNFKDADKLVQVILTTLPGQVASIYSDAPMPSDAAAMQAMRAQLVQAQQIIQTMGMTLQQLQAEVKDKRLEQVVKLAIEGDKVVTERLRGLSHLMGATVGGQTDILTTAMKGHQDLVGQQHAERLRATAAEGQRALSDAGASAQSGQAAAEIASSGGGAGANGNGAGAPPQPGMGA